MMHSDTTLNLRFTIQYLFRYSLAMDHRVCATNAILELKLQRENIFCFYNVKTDYISKAQTHTVLNAAFERYLKQCLKLVQWKIVSVLFLLCQD